MAKPRPGKPTKIRVQRRKGEWRVTTYAHGARGSRRVVGHVRLISDEGLGALADSDVQKALGADRLEHRKPA